MCTRLASVAITLISLMVCVTVPRCVCLLIFLLFAAHCPAHCAAHPCITLLVVLLIVLLVLILSLCSLLCWSACAARLLMGCLLFRFHSRSWLGIWCIVAALTVYIYLSFFLHTLLPAVIYITMCICLVKHIYCTLSNSLAWVRGRPTLYPCPLGRRGRLATPLTQACRVITGEELQRHCLVPPMPALPPTQGIVPT